jgi:thiol-disulfide isomerase/thioredoxin
MASKKAKKEIRDWAIFAAVLLILYFTGLHTDVAAFAQRIVLATGVANPKIELNQEKKTVAQYDFSLDGLDGSQLNLEEQRGKVIFINFWATWCAPCIAEMPSIQNLYDQYKDNPNVVFAMINVESKRSKAKKFITKKEFTFPVYYPNATRIPNVYSSDGIPTTYVIDRDGYIAYQKVGMASYDSKKFVEFINNLAD